MPSTSRKSTSSKRRLDFEEEHPKDAPPSEAEKRSSNASTRTPKRQKKKTQQSISFPSVTSTTSSTPVKKTKSAIVTPASEAEVIRLDDDDHDHHQKQKGFVPKYIHKNLDYKTEGRSQLPDTTLRAFSLVCETHVIPTDLQSSRVHGPLSGTCYEEKVLQSYSLGKLQAKPEFENDPAATEICVTCAKTGHVSDDCPSLL